MIRRAMVCLLVVVLAGCASYTAEMGEANLGKAYQAAQDALSQAEYWKAPQYRPEEYQTAKTRLEEVRQQHIDSPSEELVSDYRQVQILAYKATVNSLADQLHEKEDRIMALENRIKNLESGSMEQVREMEAEQSKLREHIENLTKERNRLRSMLQEQSQEVQELKQERDDIAQEFREKVEEAKVRQEQDRVIVNLEEKVLFELGKAYIKASAESTLNKIAEILKKYPERSIRVEGHADTLPINTPRFPSNWELSSQRAINVLKYLTDRQHVRPTRIAAVAFGEYQPLLPNTSPENRAQNRRVEIVLLPKERPMRKQQAME